MSPQNNEKKVFYTGKLYGLTGMISGICTFWRSKIQSIHFQTVLCFHCITLAYYCYYWLLACTALFSNLKQTLCFLVSCSSKWVTFLVVSVTCFEFPLKWCTYCNVWLLHGWYRVKLTSAILVHADCSGLKNCFHIVLIWWCTWWSVRFIALATVILTSLKKELLIVMFFFETTWLWFVS